MNFDEQYDKDGNETGYTKVDVSSKGGVKDINVKLLVAMSSASEKYLYEVKDKATGIDRYSGKETNVELGHGDCGTKKVALNFSVTPRCDEEKSGKFASFLSFDSKPKNGFDGNIVLSSNTNSLQYDDTTENKQKSVPRHVLLFHEMAENYYRTSKRQDFNPSHYGAETAENQNINVTVLPGYLDNRGKPSLTPKKCN
jgi:hypothetical protein